MTDRLIRITTALAVAAVAVVAAVISYQHAFELVRSHGETGVTARLVPFTVDGLIWAACMVVLDASRYHGWRREAWALGSWPRSGPTWRMAWDTGPSGHWSVRGPRWRWFASLELLMLLIRTERGAPAMMPSPTSGTSLHHSWNRRQRWNSQLRQPWSTVLARCEAGQSQRAIARDLDIDRRKVKRIIDQAA